MTETRFGLRKVTLALVPPEKDALSALFGVLKDCLDQGSVVLFISIRPYQNFKEEAKEIGFDIPKYLNQKQLVIVDCLSDYVESTKESIQGLFYSPSPSDLTAIGNVSAQAMSLIGTHEKKFLILDSVSTFLLYNTSGGFLRFLHFLLSQLRALEFGATILMARDNVPSKMVQVLKQYCDITINL